MNWKVEAICAGKVRPFRGDEQSAFAKQPVEGLLSIDANGLQCDTQADRVHHGGEHMAVHLYPRTHRAFWQEQIGAHPLLEEPGAFGTNLAVENIDENNVLLGDRFRLGSAILEISQPRMPCWKIEHRFGAKGMVAAILKTGRCGWYFRVIEAGKASAGDTLERIETDRAPFTISEICREIAYPKAETSAERIAAMAENELLSPSWREGGRQRLAAFG